MRLKKISLMIILALSLFVGMNISAVGASTADTLIVHYNRYDGRENEFDMWLWTGDLQGSNYAFNGSDSYGVTSWYWSWDGFIPAWGTSGTKDIILA